jgi:S-formylglutathione hydrolase FrmB
MRIVLLVVSMLVAASGDLSQKAEATRLREEAFHSAALGKVMKYRVLVPQNYAAGLGRYPVLYLLHGLSGDYTDWTNRTNLADYSRPLRLIIVMPDGGNQWYTNAADGSAPYEDYLANDLPMDVVKKYRTINSRYGRSIAGLSMGGYGALKLALKRPAAFRVAASFSGAFGVTREGALEPLIGKVEGQRLLSIFGPAGSDTRLQNDVFTLAAAAKPATAPYVYLDCGTGDSSLIAANREVVAALNTAAIEYEYHETPGAHSWDYWDRRIREFLPLLMKKLAN